MVRASVIALTALVAACTTPAKLYESGPRLTVASAKPAKAFALCVAETMRRAQTVRDDGTRYWIMETDLYGSPTFRWDFEPRGSGSVAEFRSAFPYRVGLDKVRACA